MFNKLPDLFFIGCIVGSNENVDILGLAIGIFTSEITKPNQIVSGFTKGSSDNSYFSITGNKISWYCDGNYASRQYNQKGNKYVWCSINKNI